MAVFGPADRKRDGGSGSRCLRSEGPAGSSVAVFMKHLSIAIQVPTAQHSRELDRFRRLGVKQVQMIDMRTRGQACDHKIVNAIEEATAVFFTGGSQLRITSLLGGTELDRVLHRRHEHGMVRGGTSAGAAMMSGTMILEGHSDATPRVAT